MVLTRSKKRRNLDLRQFIYQLTRQDLKIDKAFTIFSREKGAKAMKYIEFDFWFYRFLGGSTDMSGDWEFEPEGKGLVDLPVEIVRKITEDCDLESRLSLHEAFKPHRLPFQNTPIHVGLFWFVCHPTKIYLHFQTFTFKYKEKTGGCQVTHHGQKEFIANGNFLKMGLCQLRTILSLPKVKFDEFSINFIDVDVEKEKKVVGYIEKLLKSLEDHVKVRKLKVKSSIYATLPTLLPYFQPGALENLTITFEYKQNEDLYETVVGMEQWKQLKTLDSNIIYTAPIEHLFNLSEIYVKLPKLTVENAVKIRDIYFPTALIKKIEFFFRELVVCEDIKPVFGFQHYYVRYQIPNTNERLSLELKPCTFRVYGHRKTGIDGQPWPADRGRP